MDITGGSTEIVTIQAKSTDQKVREACEIDADHLQALADALSQTDVTVKNSAVGHIPVHNSGNSVNEDHGSEKLSLAQCSPAGSADTSIYSLSE